MLDWGDLNVAEHLNIKINVCVSTDVKRLNSCDLVRIITNMQAFFLRPCTLSFTLSPRWGRHVREAPNVPNNHPPREHGNFYCRLFHNTVLSMEGCLHWWSFVRKNNFKNPFELEVRMLCCLDRCLFVYFIGRMKEKNNSENILSAKWWLYMPIRKIKLHLEEVSWNMSLFTLSSRNNIN